jgi:hypothetical protein
MDLRENDAIQTAANERANLARLLGTLLARRWLRAQCSVEMANAPKTSLTSGTGKTRTRRRKKIR